jgi:phosphate transport system permease protein
MALVKQHRMSTREWLKSGEPFIWVNAAAVTLSTIAVVGILALIATRGLGHFWPADVVQAQYALTGEAPRRVLGELVESEEVTIEQIRASGVTLDTTDVLVRRDLFKFGNRDVTGTDFGWLIHGQLSNIEKPSPVLVLERREWGNFYGYLREVKEQGKVVADAQIDDARAWQELQTRLDRALALHDEIYEIEKKQIGGINYRIEKLRLDQRRLELQKDKLSAQELAVATEQIAADRAALEVEYQGLQGRLADLHQQVARDSLTAEVAGGQTVEIALEKIVHA